MEEQEGEQVELAETSKKEKLKNLDVTATILDLSIPDDWVFHRRIRELQMYIRMDVTTHPKLNLFRFTR